MAYLLSFTPDKKLGFNCPSSADDEKVDATETQLFEALYIAYKATDAPKYGKELKTSIKLEQEIGDKSEEGGSIKLALCPFCGIRMARHDERRTITHQFDLIIEDTAMEYLKACLGKWERVFKELRPYLAVLYDRFESMQSKTPEDWKKFITDRDTPKEIGNTA